MGGNQGIIERAWRDHDGVLRANVKAQGGRYQVVALPVCADSPDDLEGRRVSNINGRWSFVSNGQGRAL
jgi:hypothetical protein